MTLREAAKTALETNNISMLNKVVDQARMQFGWDYDSIRCWFAKRFNIDADTFEDLMYACDKQSERE